MDRTTELFLQAAMFNIVNLSNVDKTREMYRLVVQREAHNLLKKCVLNLKNGVD